MPFVWSHKKKKQARVLVFSQSRERLVRGLPDKGRTKVRFLPPNKLNLQFFSLAGVEGIEPSSGVLETLILPMNYTPKIFLILL